MLGASGLSGVGGVFSFSARSPGLWADASPGPDSVVLEPCSSPCGARPSLGVGLPHCPPSLFPRRSTAFLWFSRLLVGAAPRWPCDAHRFLVQCVLGGGGEWGPRPGRSVAESQGGFLCPSGSQGRDVPAPSRVSFRAHTLTERPLGSGFPGGRPYALGIGNPSGPLCRPHQGPRTP